MPGIPQGAGPINDHQQAEAVTPRLQMASRWAPSTLVTLMSRLCTGHPHEDQKIIRSAFPPPPPPPNLMVCTLAKRVRNLHFQQTWGLHDLE